MYEPEVFTTISIKRFVRDRLRKRAEQAGVIHPDTRKGNISAFLELAVADDADQETEHENSQTDGR